MKIKLIRTVGFAVCMSILTGLGVLTFKVTAAQSPFVFDSEYWEYVDLQRQDPVTCTAPSLDDVKAKCYADSFCIETEHYYSSGDAMLLANTHLNMFCNGIRFSMDMTNSGSSEVYVDYNTNTIYEGTGEGFVVRDFSNTVPVDTTATSVVQIVDYLAAGDYSCPPPCCLVSEEYAGVDYAINEVDDSLMLTVTIQYDNGPVDTEVYTYEVQSDIQPFTAPVVKDFL